MSNFNDNQPKQNTIPPYSTVITKIKESFMDCPDINIRKIYLECGIEAHFIFVEDLVDKDLLQRDFMKYAFFMSKEELNDEKIIRSLPISNINFYYDIDSIIDKIMSGEAIFIFDGMNFAISCILRKFEKRAIQEPQTEKNVRGSHEGFVETINTNMAILRRMIKSNNLKFRVLKVGTSTKQVVAITYINGIANLDILNELVRRISEINFDGMIGNGYIEQIITDSPNSPFPQFLATERPDRAVGMLLEGRFVIFLDGTPVSIVAPVSFFSFFPAPDDYNINWIVGSFLGLLRIISMTAAVFLPAIYIALTSFNYYMVPLRLLIPLAESRERVPFPPYVEAVIMEITIEMLREASVRLPTYIGSTIGIIGGIVIGQAAVQAGIVSVLMIIVVSITAIASFVSPVADMGFAIRFYRFIVMMASAVFGVVGIVTLTVLLIAHLLSIESLDQPYFDPVIPFRFKDLKDVITRVPYKYMRKRPTQAKPIDKERGKNDE